MRMEISDRALDNYYARDYYGPGTDYFDPPYPDWETEDDIDAVIDEEWEEDTMSRYIVKLFSKGGEFRFKFNDYDVASTFVKAAMENHASVEGRTLIAEIEKTFEEDF